MAATATDADSAVPPCPLTLRVGRGESSSDAMPATTTVAASTFIANAAEITERRSRITRTPSPSSTDGGVRS
ncbi:MAG TPA: hypothetical protein VLF18_07205 [Tahibacter sp.]|nr:hypothetical protein [Tahibacter sp.]